jgi:hypothetical protein
MPESLLEVMETELGDSVCLDTAHLKPGGEGRVVLMSHATGGEQREWATIADFLEELLTDRIDPE